MDFYSHHGPSVIEKELITLKLMYPCDIRHCIYLRLLCVSVRDPPRHSRYPFVLFLAFEFMKVVCHPSESPRLYTAGTVNPRESQVSQLPTILPPAYGFPAEVHDKTLITDKNVAKENVPECEGKLRQFETCL